MQRFSEVVSLGRVRACFSSGVVSRHLVEAVSQIPRAFLFFTFSRAIAALPVYRACALASMACVFFRQETAYDAIYAINNTLATQLRVIQYDDMKQYSEITKGYFDQAKELARLT
jgi:hypothetical protein